MTQEDGAVNFSQPLRCKYNSLNAVDSCHLWMLPHLIGVDLIIDQNLLTTLVGESGFSNPSCNVVTPGMASKLKTARQQPFRVFSVFPPPDFCQKPVPIRLQPSTEPLKAPL